jgi:hypothetical protein
MTQSGYRSFASSEPGLPLFLEPWWLDAVCDGKWDAVVTGRGALPYHTSKRLGFTRVVMPRLTQYIGPWFKEGVDQRKAITELLDALPRFDGFTQSLHPSITDILPFHWRGYANTVRYTYLLWDTAHFDKDTRYQVRKAAEFGVSVEDDKEYSPLYKMNQRLYHPETLRRVTTESIRRDQGIILNAYDHAGGVAGVLFMVWDHNTTHYLVGVTNTGCRHLCAGAALLEEAIKRTVEAGRVFNFEGSMIQPIENYFRGFGGVLTPYFKVTKINNRLLKMAYAAREVLS